MNNTNTPFFPALRARLAAMGIRTSQKIKTVRAYTLCQLEDRFKTCLPLDLFPKAAAGLNSRDSIYTRWRTFWCMIWQAFNPKSSFRQVVDQIKALFCLNGQPTISESDGAYCIARQRLPATEFPKALAATAKAADAAAPKQTLLQGRPVKIADGSTLTLPDTPKNRAAYPPVQSDLPNFPLMRIVVLFCLLSGAILSLALSNLHTAELPLLNQLLSQLVRGDILMGDRGFGNYTLMALLQGLNLGVDFIGRSARHVDGRQRLKRLGKNDWLVGWEKGYNPSFWLPLVQWKALPEQMTVRIIRASCYVKGFRVRQVTLVTTLLDAELYPAQQIIKAYLRRWRLEMCLDDLKTTLEIEMLRSCLPETACKEVYAHLIAHNLIRWTMAQAATEHGKDLERISFKGSLDALRQFTQAIVQARSAKTRRELWTELLRTLAADLVPERPGRREPRAVKRKKNKYSRLSVSRDKFRDRPKSSVRLTIARKRKQGLI